MNHDFFVPFICALLPGINLFINLYGNYYRSSRQVAAEHKTAARLYPPAIIIIFDLIQTAVYVIAAMLLGRAFPFAAAAVWALLLSYALSTWIVSFLPHKLYPQGITAVSAVLGYTHRCIPWSQLELMQRRSNSCLLLRDKEKGRTIRLRHRPQDRQLADELLNQYLAPSATEAGAKKHGQKQTEA